MKTGVTRSIKCEQGGTGVIRVTGGTRGNKKEKRLTRKKGVTRGNSGNRGNKG